jgi:hypothetical protein
MCRGRTMILHQPMLLPTAITRHSRFCRAFLHLTFSEIGNHHTGQCEMSTRFSFHLPRQLFTIPIGTSRTSRSTISLSARQPKSDAQAPCHTCIQTHGSRAIRQVHSRRDILTGSSQIRSDSNVNIQHLSAQLEANFMIVQSCILASEHYVAFHPRYAVIGRSVPTWRVLRREALN